MKRKQKPLVLNNEVAAPSNFAWLKKNIQQSIVGFKNHI